VKGKLACVNLSPKLLGCGQSGNNASWRQQEWVLKNSISGTLFDSEDTRFQAFFAHLT
jgi:hypothetical protein